MKGSLEIELHTNLENQEEKIHFLFSKMQPELVNRRAPIRFYDNGRSHVDRITLQKLTDLGGYEILPHLPFSPDFPHTNNYFSSIQTFLHQKAICSKQKVETAFKDFLASKPLEFYRRGIALSMEKMYRCSGIIFWLIKTLFKFIISRISLFWSRT